MRVSHRSMRSCSGKKIDAAQNLIVATGYRLDQAGAIGTHALAGPHSRNYDLLPVPYRELAATPPCFMAFSCFASFRRRSSVEHGQSARFVVHMPPTQRPSKDCGRLHRVLFSVLGERTNWSDRCATLSRPSVATGQRSLLQVAAHHCVLQRWPKRASHAPLPRIKHIFENR